jgi:transmembrane sensor
VEHGRVEVAWLGGATVLLSGQGGLFPPVTEPEAAPGEEPDTPRAEPPPASPAPSAHGAGGSASDDRWRRNALAGDYARAYEELKAMGADAVRDDPGDLMLAADIARLSGHPEDSVRPLRAVVERHSGDRRAPVAAFTLGRVLDDLGRPAQAAAAFEKARVLWPAGPLSEDALSRSADAWQRAGRTAAARAAAGEYERRYPNGRHAAAMRKILAP